MEAREAAWLQKKIGVISTSEVDKLLSKSGKWTDGNKTYLYKIERQRYLKQPAPPLNTRSINLGNENEPYAVAWLRENRSAIIRHCDSDYPEKIFIVTDFGLGCSPDAYEVDIIELRNEQGAAVAVTEKKLALIEIKVVVGEEPTNFYFSPTVPKERKRLRAFGEHREQMAGQLLAHPDIDTVRLMKYDPQLDDNEFDLRPVLDKTRGIVFDFTRAEFGSYLDEMKERVKFADQYLNSGADIDLIDKAWTEYLKTKQGTQGGTDTTVPDPGIPYTLTESK